MDEGVRCCQFVKDGDVGTGKIVDVDVVTQAGAIRCRVVGAKDLEGAALSSGSKDSQGNEV